MCITGQNQGINVRVAEFIQGVSHLIHLTSRFLTLSTAEVLHVNLRINFEKMISEDSLFLAEYSSLFHYL